MTIYERTLYLPKNTITAINKILARKTRYPGVKAGDIIKRLIADFGDEIQVHINIRNANVPYIDPLLYLGEEESAAQNFTGKKINALEFRITYGDSTYVVRIRPEKITTLRLTGEERDTLSEALQIALNSPDQYVFTHPQESDNDLETKRTETVAKILKSLK